MRPLRLPVTCATSVLHSALYEEGPVVKGLYEEGPVVKGLYEEGPVVKGRATLPASMS